MWSSDPAAGQLTARSSAAREVAVARQPILTADRRLHGYQLRFHSSDLESFFTSTDPTRASSQVITDSLLAIGIDTIGGGRSVFVDVTRDLLLDHAIEVLLPDRAVLQVGPDVGAHGGARAAVGRLRRAGYRVAVRGVRRDAPHLALLDQVDYVKVDLADSDREERAWLARTLPRDLARIAEGVEHERQVDEARAFGCTLFQGYFFARPVVVVGRDVATPKLGHLRLLRETARDGLDFATFETIIKADVALSYKFLKYINAASFGWRRRIGSIKDALVLLGEGGVRRWACLVTLAGLVADKPPELAIMSAVRARFCESVGAEAGLRSRQLDLFSMGMFSLIDAILDQALADALEHLPLSDDVKAALLGKGGALADVLEVVTAYERGRWDDVAAAARRLGTTEAGLLGHYVDAVEWARDTFA